MQVTRIAMQVPAERPAYILRCGWIRLANLEVQIRVGRGKMKNEKKREGKNNRKIGGKKKRNYGPFIILSMLHSFAKHFSKTISDSLENQLLQHNHSRSCYRHN